MARTYWCPNADVDVVAARSDAYALCHPWPPRFVDAVLAHVPRRWLATATDDADAAERVRDALRKPGVSLGPFGMDAKQATGVARLVVLRDLGGG